MLVTLSKYKIQGAALTKGSIDVPIARKQQDAINTVAKASPWAFHAKESDGVPRPLCAGRSYRRTVKNDDGGDSWRDIVAVLHPDDDDPNGGLTTADIIEEVMAAGSLRYGTPISGGDT